MKKMGFNYSWVSWIFQCNSTVRYSILINGKATDSFIPPRGIRQGNPISPYLFLFVSDVLSKLFEGALAANQILGYRINRHCPTLTYLLFVDDTIIFRSATMEEATHIKHLLDEYNTAFGQ